MLVCGFCLRLNTKVIKSYEAVNENLIIMSSSNTGWDLWMMLVFDFTSFNLFDPSLVK